MLLKTIMKNSSRGMFEAGLPRLYHKQIGIGTDLHDILDPLIYGLMSPCPHKSIVTGLSWYEINPVLFREIRQGSLKFAGSSRNHAIDDRVAPANRVSVLSRQRASLTASRTFWG